MKTIAFCNCGTEGTTSSLVYHLAWMYARLDTNVLVVDLNPQARLTTLFLDDAELAPLWSETADRRTIYGALRPLLDAPGEVTTPYVAEPEPGIGLIVGDLLLASLEEEMSDEWTACLEGKPTVLSILPALRPILRRGAAKVDAKLVLVDIGPNVAALARAALLTADSVVFPLAPDLYSLQGLAHLGPTLRRWRRDWKERHRLRNAEGASLPKGSMRPLGYVVVEDSVRFDRPVSSYRHWLNRIPVAYRTSVIGATSSSSVTIGNDPHRLATIKPYASLKPLAEEARKPMFALTPADGAMRGHGATIRGCYRDFRTLAAEIGTRAGSPLEGDQSNQGSPGSRSRRERRRTITFRPMRAMPDSPQANGAFTAGRMGDLANSLEETMAKIERWGIAVPGQGRLPATVELLRDVAYTGSFPESKADLKKIAYAASDAQDFIAVRGMLPPQPLDPTVEVLRRAIRGRIGVSPHEAYQAQSELWVGAALSCAGVRFGVLVNPKGPSPDYVVWNETSEYAIEVKRLAGGSSVRRRVSDAARQTRGGRYHGGALYVDLTDWLPSEMTLRFAAGPPDLNSPQMPIARKINQLRQEIFDDSTSRIRQRRLHLFAVTAFARFIHWDLTDLSQFHLSRYIAPLWFWHSVKDDRYHRARWLAELLQSGARNMGLQGLDAHEIEFQSDR